MNAKKSVFGKLLPSLFLLAGMIGAGSFALAAQRVSDEKIHIQDTPGKIQTNVPVGGSRDFSPLPVEWSEDIEIEDIDGTVLGTTIVTKQKVVFNMALQVATEGGVELSVDNNSDDDQIVLIKAGSTPHVIIDMESDEVEIQGLVGHNEWLAVVPDGDDKRLIMEISTTDAGFYPIVVELERVG